MPTPDPGALFPLPKIDNAPHLCVTLSIPGDQESISNFVGSLNRLAIWNNYRRDPDKRGIKIARVWRDIVENITFQDCGDLPTGSLDEDLLMTSLCENLRWNNGVLEALCCGVWSPIGASSGPIPNANSQPGPSAAPGVDQCLEYYVTLNAKNRWILPFAVNGGDTIAIASASGGWNDGTLNWSCPQGTLFALSICGAANAVNGADPIPTISHMRLIGQYGITAGAGYFDAYAGYTIPAGIVNQQLTLQANDSNLADNQGDVSFKVTVCHKVPSMWSSVNDFSLGQLAWTAYVCAGDCGNACNAGAAGAYATSRWNSTIYACSNQRVLLPQTPSFALSYVTSVDITYNSNNAYSGSNFLNVLYHDATGWHAMAPQSIIAGTNTANVPVGHNADQIRCEMIDQTALTMVSYISKVIINGQGTKPSQLN